MNTELSSSWLLPPSARLANTPMTVHDTSLSRICSPSGLTPATKISSSTLGPMMHTLAPASSSASVKRRPWSMPIPRASMNALLTPSTRDCQFCPL